MAKEKIKTISNDLKISTPALHNEKEAAEYKRYTQSKSSKSGTKKTTTKKK